jgi:hypothetical protein
MQLELSVPYCFLRAQALGRFLNLLQNYPPPERQQLFISRFSLIAAPGCSFPATITAGVTRVEAVGPYWLIGYKRTAKSHLSAKPLFKKCVHL